MSDSTGEGRIPLLPLRDIVVFPHMVVPLFVGRPKSIQALEEAVEGGSTLGIDLEALVEHLAEEASALGEADAEDSLAPGGGVFLAEGDGGVPYGGEA